MQTIDLGISKLKYEEELSAFLSGQEIQRKRGIYVLHAEFPNVILSFSAHKLRPAPIVFVININFDNYDLEPLSVRFIDPFTWEDLPQLPARLIRKIPLADGKPSLLDLTLAEPNRKPMICLPGIREYHEHPAHTGDPWLLHRGKGGEGTLGFIIDKIYDYGIAPITSYHVILQLNAMVPNPQLNIDQNLIQE